MAKLKTFYRTFVKSLTKPAYYKDILSAKFSFSLKYLALLLFLISIFGAFRIALGMQDLKPNLPGFIEKEKKVVVNVYPDKLVITLKSGKIFTNVREPYFIEMPEDGRDLGLTASHLVAIDTKGKAEDFQKYNSLVLLTSESAVVSDGQSGFKVYPLRDILKDVPDGAELNKTIYTALTSQLLPYLDKLPGYLTILAMVAVIFWPFLATLFSLSGHMFYLVFAAFILLLITKVMKKNLTYRKVYQLSLHALTLPILISFALSLYGKFVPFLFTAILIVFMIVVIKELPSKIDKSN
ncbi:MAG: DUF1189 family protein [Patescibacteria group bacterium]